MEKIHRTTNTINMPDLLNNKRIGIWGYGVTGRAATEFCLARGARVWVMDPKLTNNSPESGELSKLIHDLPARHEIHTQSQIKWTDETHLEEFLKSNDLIIPSPGINIAPYLSQLQGKLLPEIDLFFRFAQKPIIAITGSVGKTTITSVLSDVLTGYGKKVLTGGNIGTPCLELLKNQDNFDLFVLELSSFQLEYSTCFAPDIAVITNISPNHLDRHKSMEQYIEAKCKIFQNQKELLPCTNRQVILPLNMHEIANISHDNLQTNTVPNTQTNTSSKKQSALSRFTFMHPKSPTKSELEMLTDQEALFYLDNTDIMYYESEKLVKLLNISQLPPITFPENWLTICAIIHSLKLPITELIQLSQTAKAPEHRLEFVATINGVSFYNDSKSTVSKSTIAAVTALAQRGKQPITLLLGGLSKGVNRAPLIAEIAPFVNMTYCFGAEASELADLCTAQNIPTQAFKTLEDAVSAIALAINKAPQASGSVLLSPAGSSFDLFANYQERGHRFKALVHDLANRPSSVLPEQELPTL